MTHELEESFADGIATLTLNRPASRNALTRDMLNQMAQTLPRLAQDR